MKRKGTFLLWIGSALLAASLGLAIYNIMAEQTAKAAADQVFEYIHTARDNAIPVVRSDKEIAAHDPSIAGSTAEDLREIPDYILNPDMDMPTNEYDGHMYIGSLEIPTLELSLPVMNEWSYSGLKIAPGRYAGSVYTHDIVIAAHNYVSHFGTIEKLSQDDTVVFTDMDGNVFTYQVLGTEYLSPNAVDDMISGEWDLTLFTCTVGATQRVAVRCAMADDQSGLGY